MENNGMTNAEIKKYISSIKASEKDRLRQNNKKPYFDNKGNIEYRLKNYESSLKIRVSHKKKVDFILSQDSSESDEKNEKSFFDICKEAYNSVSTKRIFFGGYKGIRCIEVLSIYNLNNSELKKIRRYEAKEKKDVTEEHKKSFKNVLMKYVKS